MRATDPWVSYDSAGKAYQISLGIQSANLDLTGVEVATSTDDGATWGAPVRLITDTNPVFFNDKESITADWRADVGAGKAYATWIRGDLPGGDNISPVGAAHSFAYSGKPMFSMTSDGGASWSTPKPMTNAVVYMQGNQIVVLPDGTLVDVGAMLFRGSGVQPTPQQYFWAAMVSRNGGKTWGAPIKIAPLGTTLLTNPDIPEPTTIDETVRAGDYIPDVAVDHATGAIYMVFADGISTGFNHVKLTKSTDGGKRWSTPVDVTTTPTSTHSFNGTVEVTSDGTVAVMYYDFRTNDTETAGLPTDVWLTHSHDGGATWTEQPVYGSFDMEKAPVARGWFLGDYQGLAAIDRDLILFFSVSTEAEDSADVIAIRATATP
jgi:Neuraminidase (sialidase)